MADDPGNLRALKHGLPHDRIDGLPRTFSDKTQNANVQDVEPALPLIDVIGRLASDASHALETKIHIDALDSFPFTGKDQSRSSSPKPVARSEQIRLCLDRNRAGSRSIERRSAISSPPLDQVLPRRARRIRSEPEF